MRNHSKITNGNSRIRTERISKMSLYQKVRGQMAHRCSLREPNSNSSLTLGGM